MKRPLYKPIAIYSAAHLAVDFCCAAAMFYASRSGGGAALLLIYNFAAFAMQLPLGILADRLGHGPLFAAAGCLLVGAAPLPPLPGAALALLSGLGNAAFHIGAGVEVLDMGRGRAAPLGIFVSPGAIGIFLGGRYAGLSGLNYLCAALMLCFALAIPFAMGRGKAGRALPPPRLDGVLMALLLVVCIRSYCGTILSFPWRTGVWAGLSLWAVVLGKALGGAAADHMGMRRTSIISLSLCLPLFLLGDAPILGLAAILLFNMTMPITLNCAATLMGEHRGLAFGMLTFGLFMGLCPAYLGYEWAGGWAYALLCAASLSLMLYALPRKERAA